MADDLEQSLPENVALRLRHAGNRPLADALLAAWADHRRALLRVMKLNEPVTETACTIWEEAHGEAEAAWEQVERLQAQVAAWFER